MKSFFSDTRASDTIPLKLMVYLGLLAAVFLLAAQAWENASPVLDKVKTEGQLEEAALSLRSIQTGYARELSDSHSPDGAMCSLSFSLPASVSFVSFGIDPDPDLSGNLSDSEWIPANNTILCQTAGGIRKRVVLEGAPVFFCKGAINEEENWVPAPDSGVVIEAPVSGTFVFEMVAETGKRYTMARF